MTSTIKAKSSALGFLNTYVNGENDLAIRKFMASCANTIQFTEKGIWPQDSQSVVAHQNKTIWKCQILF